VLLSSTLLPIPKPSWQFERRAYNLSGNLARTNLNAALSVPRPYQESHLKVQSQLRRIEWSKPMPDSVKAGFSYRLTQKSLTNLPLAAI